MVCLVDWNFEMTQTSYLSLPLQKAVTIILTIRKFVAGNSKLNMRLVFNWNAWR